MYKALRLHPQKWMSRGERMIMTHHARARIHEIFALHTVNDIMRITDKGHVAVYNWLRGKKTPTLPTYLALMEILYGDDMREKLKDDINYKYANILVSPSEMKRRLRRLSEYHWRNGMYEYAEEHIHYGWRQIMYTVNYTERRTINIYSALLYWMSGEEQSRGYSDCLILER